MTFRLASYSPGRFRTTVHENLKGLFDVLGFNKDHRLLFFRISSETIPFASHPICRVDWAEEFRAELKQIGAFALENQMRISMHPDQFVLINAMDPKIVDRSIADLKWHTRFLQRCGFGRDAKIQIHVGGVYGDKTAARERFIKNYQALPNDVKERLVIENDDRLYSLADCLAIHEATGIPVLLDSFHHECLNSGETLRDAIRQAALTWQREDGCLMMDYSSQKPGARFGAHTEQIDSKKFAEFLRAAKGTELDVMLEIKDKEKSALLARDIIDGVC